MEENTVLTLLARNLTEPPELLEWSKMVMVNLHPDTEEATEFVRFDQAQVRCVLARIAADLDTIAG
jgi:hypothetical protein